VPFGTSYIIKTIRLLALEDLAINKACQALGGFERAQLMQEATLFEAFRLGVRFSSEPPPSLAAPWPYLPERGHEPTDIRVSISMPATVAELMSAAASHVNASETLFIVGSTLAHIGRLQKHFRGVHAVSERDAREARSALQAIRLPPQYRYRSGRAASRA
jgi:hypothetical protein